MKKKTIYLVILLLLNIIFIGTAKADSCINVYNEYWSNQTNFTISSQPGMVSKEVTFQGRINLDMSYDYIKIPFYVVLLDKNNIISNINLPATCTKKSDLENFTNPEYMIHYADGTTARVSAVEYDTICENYNINGTATLPYEPYINSTYVRIRYANLGSMNCELDSNLVATCRIPKNESKIDVKGYVMHIGLNKQQSTIKGGIVSDVIQYCREDSEDIKNGVNAIRDKLDQNNQEQKETNKKIDDIKNSDISSDSKEAPNTNEYNNYQEAEKGLFEKMDQADTSNLDVAIDGNSANFVWDTITRFYNSNALLMNFLISILSIGIIKMALGR